MVVGVRRFHVAAFALILPLASATGEAAAQDGSKKTVPSVAVPAQPPQVVMPDAEKIVLLLRSSLLTLNDALQTGNFTVLRDVAAPGFREANSAARLSEIFGGIARQGVDLTAVAIIVPQLTEPPALDHKTNMVRIKGFFPGQPVRIDFDVAYQAVGSRWRLFGLSVQPTVSAAEKSAAPAKK
jgi:hypothetical protein